MGEQGSFTAENYHRLMMKKRRRKLKLKSTLRSKLRKVRKQKAVEALWQEKELASYTAVSFHLRMMRTRKTRHLNQKARARSRSLPRSQKKKTVRKKGSW